MSGYQVWVSSRMEINTCRVKNKILAEAGNWRPQTIEKYKLWELKDFEEGALSLVQGCAPISFRSEVAMKPQLTSDLQT